MLPTFRIVATLGVTAVSALVVVSSQVAARAAGRMFDVDDAPAAPVVIVPGARVRNGRPMNMLRQRLDVAVALVHDGRARAVLVSGDAGGRSGDEIEAMIGYLVEHGIDRERIVADPHGLDTYDTAHRALVTYGVRQAHNSRREIRYSLIPTAIFFRPPSPLKETTEYHSTCIAEVHIPGSPNRFRSPHHPQQQPSRIPGRVLHARPRHRGAGRTEPVGTPRYRHRRDLTPALPERRHVRQPERCRTRGEKGGDAMAGTDPTERRRFAFTTRPHVAVDDATGNPIGLDEIDTRIRWLLDLITGAETDLLTRLWHPATFDTLAAGRDRDGRALPTHGHVVAARLGWIPTYPDGVYAPSRVSRVVTAQATATLRTLAYRDTAIASLSARFDPATGHLAPPASGQARVPSGFARGVRRQLVARTRRAEASGASTSDAAQPERLRITDIQTPPKVSALARLAAADKQLAELTVTGDTMVLTVKLPTTSTPTTRAQWRAVRLTAALPPHLCGRPITAWHLPTLTLDGRGLLLRCAATEAVPGGDLSSATVAVGVDWSPATLGAAAIATDTGDGLISDFRGYTYDDRGLGIKLARLQTEGQFLHRKAARLARLAENAPPQLRAEVEAKIAVLDANRTAVGVKRGRINRELAFHFACRVADYAVAADATVIAVEDLSTLEARGRGRVNNNRAAQSARRQAADALAHTAARAGVVTVTVPARGSSAWCPGCNAPLTRPGGYHHAWCTHCEVGGNRDHVAGVNLAKRALLGRGAAVRTRGGSLEIRTTEHAPVRRCRDKTGPTPSRPRHRRVRRSVPGPTSCEGVNKSKSRPASEASVWDTVEPAVSDDGVGSREERGSGLPGMLVAGSIRFT